MQVGFFGYVVFFWSGFHTSCKLTQLRKLMTPIVIIVFEKIKWLGAGIT